MASRGSGSWAAPRARTASGARATPRARAASRARAAVRAAVRARAVSKARADAKTKADATVRVHPFPGHHPQGFLRAGVALAYPQKVPGTPLEAPGALWRLAGLVKCSLIFTTVYIFLLVLDSRLQFVSSCLQVFDCFLQLSTTFCF